MLVLIRWVGCTGLICWQSKSGSGPRISVRQSSATLSAFLPLFKVNHPTQYAPVTIAFVFCMGMISLLAD